MSTKRAWTSLAGLLLPLCVAAAEPGAGGKSLVIGVSVAVGDYPIYAQMLRGAEAEAKALGVKLQIADAHFSTTGQRSDLERFVAMKVDGIVVAPMPKGDLTRTVDAAVAAGIPVVKVLADEGADKALLAVGGDVAEGGRLAAKYVIAKLGNKGSVIVLEGLAGTGFHHDLKQAFEEGLEGSNVKVLASVPTDWYRPGVRRAVSAALTQYPEFDAFVALDDDIILGALDAMSAAGIDPAAKVTVGFDAIPEAVRRVHEGALGATFDQRGDEQGKIGLRALVDHLRGKKAPERRQVRVSPVIVTRAGQD